MSGDHNTPLLTRRAALATAGAGALALAAKPGRAADAPKKGGVLRVANRFNPSSLDPIAGRASPEFTTLFLVYDALLTIDPGTTEVRPGLAKSFRFTDPTTLELVLEQGVTFHDGTPCDAEAVKFNLERCKTYAKSVVKPDLEAVTSIEAAAPDRVLLHLSHASAGLPAILTDRAGCMVSPKAIKDGVNLDRKPVGAGAFKFVSWEDNDKIVVVRNETYWKKGLPYLDGITQQLTSDYGTALRALTAGEADTAIFLDLSQKPQLDAAKDLVATYTNTTLIEMMFLNYGRPPLDDVRVRQALNYAIDRDEISKVMAFGLEPSSSSLFPQGFWATDPATANFYKYDPAKAKALLAEAGHPDGLDLDVLGRSDAVGVRESELIAAQAAKAGFRFKMSRADPSITSARFGSPERFGAARIGPSGGRADPGQFYGQLYAKSAFWNVEQQDIPGFAPLLAATEQATDPAARKQAMFALQKFCVEQALSVPMLITVAVHASRPKVKGMTVDSLLKFKFGEAWLAS